MHVAPPFPSGFIVPLLHTLSFSIEKQSSTPEQLHLVELGGQSYSEETSPGLTLRLSLFMEPLKSVMSLVTLDPSADEVTTPVRRKKAIVAMTLAINRDLLD